VTEEYLNELFEGVPGQFHSLDYSSATDLLNPTLSRMCMGFICDTVGLSDDYRELCIKALVGHKIEGELQLWGQLMGSIMSFIILCIINFAVVRLSMEISESRIYTINEIPCAINGDDGLVRASSHFMGIWEDVAAVAGLNPSLGKTYSHNDYVNVNSTSFTLLPSGLFQKVPYVNMGLVMGMTRSEGGTTKELVHDTLDPRVPTIGARHRSLLKSCPYHMRLKVHELFLRKNIDFLSSLHIPWYIPESLGGVGLMPLVTFGDVDIDAHDNYMDTNRSYQITSTGHICGPSRRDVIIAWSIFDRANNKSFPVGTVPSLQPIRARPVWFTRFRNYNSNLSHVKVLDQESAFMDLSCYYLSPSLVSERLLESSRIEMYKRNERAWVSLSKLMDGVNPLGISLFLDL